MKLKLSKILSVLLVELALTGVGVNATNVNLRQQSTHQRKTSVLQVFKHKSNRSSNWFNDGLSKRNLKARAWVSWHESRHHWKVLSYGKRCVGYFQLDPRYLGHKDGHTNLNHEHQVRVADAYVSKRYGNWVHAKRFWQVHHWY